MMTARRWIAHPGHVLPDWKDAIRRELIAAYRRGTMDAQRCLTTYRAQGEVLPPEAVVYLAARVVAERVPGVSWLSRAEGRLSAEVLSDHGQRELAAICEADRDEFDGMVEAGRRFFFPARCPRG